MCAETLALNLTMVMKLVLQKTNMKALSYFEALNLYLSYFIWNSRIV